MAYRRSYYRKDGTYVQGHFTNHRSRGGSPKKGNGLYLIRTIRSLTKLF
ncbi:hypothetical protein [Flavobacterium cerinum]|uniref:Uncharacterized protein n=1 Tax=Flavobacterium cerinum TaxID=2502784 RepID=A0ABY5ING9_9FLAO|nr:hypothetical protein [Flavobacterium cerinum]UUC44386.1 hypothetical protein NOX80_12155 [Flavobacterium cerinum]